MHMAEAIAVVTRTGAPAGSGLHSMNAPVREPPWSFSRNWNLKWPPLTCICCTTPIRMLHHISPPAHQLYDYSALRYLGRKVRSSKHLVVHTTSWRVRCNIHVHTFHLHQIYSGDLRCSEYICQYTIIHAQCTLGSLPANLVSYTVATF